MTLRAPFPYFGGKRRAASLVWEAIGNVDHYVEPFCGSAAVLLARPHEGRCETVNDADGMVCVGPDTRILRADLRWQTAGETRVGDQLLAFDENNGPPQVRADVHGQRTMAPPARMRRWRLTTVTGMRVVRRPAYRLVFDDGTAVIASEDHMWLAGKSVAGGRGARWVTTKNMRCDSSAYKTHVVKLCDPVDRENTAEAGWMGGFYDGEGSVRGTGAGWRITVCQKLGPEADRAEGWLKANGFDVRRSVRDRNNPAHQPIAVLDLLGGMREILRFLMQVRPERLIRNALSRVHERSIYARERQVVGLVEKTFLGDVDVVAIETDSSTYVAEGLASHNCNFWRAVRAAPDAVAEACDWPVIEADLHARHLWLIGQRESMTERLIADPEWYDARIAGWWVWGACAWIGTGWCDSGRPSRQLPHLGDEGRGVHRPSRQLPHLSTEGSGVHAPRRGRAVGTDHVDAEDTADWLRQLSARLRRVRVACGDWRRVVASPSTLYPSGRGSDTYTAGVYLDPPYSEGAQQYAVGGTGTALSAHVRAWCVEHERDARLRIVLSGYEGEHTDLEARGWRVVAWKTKGGYEGGGPNQRRERLWLSPGCLDAGRAHLSVLTRLAAKYG